MSQESQSERILVNMNDQIAVSLTYAGEQAWGKYWGGAVPPEIRKGATALDGRVTFQLWEAMAIFGPSCSIGGPILFVRNEVEFLPEMVR